MPRFLADVLTWPGNRFYITCIKAARDFSIPPTVLILKDKQPSDGWSAIDKKLVIAFQILEDETCPDCGTPVWIGHSEDNSVVFDVKSRICYACAEIETQREKESKRKNHKPVKGKKEFVVLDEDAKQPTRQEYYDSLSGLVDNAIE